MKLQNKATWISTTTEGYKVRVQFLPFNEAEQKKVQAILMNADVAIVMATTQGPLTVDLMFSAKSMPDIKPAAIASETPAQVPAPLVESQPASLLDKVKAAVGMAKPDASDKVQ